MFLMVRQNVFVNRVGIDKVPDDHQHILIVTFNNENSVYIVINSF